MVSGLFDWFLSLGINSLGRWRTEIYQPQWEERHLLRTVGAPHPDTIYCPYSWAPIQTGLFHSFWVYSDALNLSFLAQNSRPRMCLGTPPGFSNSGQLSEQPWNQKGKESGIWAPNPLWFDLIFETVTFRSLPQSTRTKCWHIKYIHCVVM